MSSTLGFLSTLLQPWWLYVAHATWQSALLAAIILGLAWGLRRRPASLRYGLLLVALLKFAMPPMLSFPTGVFSWAPLSSGQLSPNEQWSAEVPTVSESSSMGSVDLRPPATDQAVPALGFGPAPLGPSVAAQRAPEAIQAVASPSIPAPWPSWKAGLLAIHMLGVLLVALWMVWSWRGLHRLVKRSSPLTDNTLHAVLAELSLRMGVRRAIRVLVSPEDCAPMAFGILRPTVVLPEALLRRLPGNEVRVVLAHELAHHRRRDAWFIVLENLLLLVWWFNPMLRLLIRAIRRTREDCCDDLVLAMHIADNATYCDGLLRAASTVGRARQAHAALGFTDRLHPLGRRLTRIMDATVRRSVRLSLVGSIAVIGFALVALPGLRPADAAAGAKEQDKQVETTSADFGKGLLAYYPLDGDARDGSRAGNDGAIHGSGHFAQGARGNGLRLGGSDDYIEVAALPAGLLGSRPKFVGLWFLPDTPGPHGLFYMGTPQEDRDGPGRSFRFMTDRSGRLGLDVSFGVGYSSITLDSGTWNYLFAYWDGGKFTVGKVTRDAVLAEPVDMSSWGSPPSNLDQGIIQIGRAGSYGNWIGARGVMDDVRVYERVPADDELRLLYSHPQPPPEVARAAAPEAAASRLDPIPPADALPGNLVFHGRYTHRSRGQEYRQPASLWIKQQENGALRVLSHLSFFNETALAVGDANHRPVSYAALREPSGRYPAFDARIEFQEAKAIQTRHWGDEREDGKECPIESGALFDLNSRPDPFALAPILVRRFALKEGETKEFTMCDWGNSQQGKSAFPSYRVRVEHKGKEEVTVPAGKFEANHLVLTQLTSADTWYKKREGHITEFWVLDDNVIVRILRHREPYEVLLLDWDAPADLPGLKERGKPQTAEKQGAAAGAPPPAGAPGEPAPSTMSGRVTDTQGAPVEGVEVFAKTWGGQPFNTSKANTGKDGAFRLENVLPDREYRVFVQADGYTASYLTRRTQKGETSGFDFRLEKGAFLSGRVLDTENQPLAGVTLELVPTVWQRDENAPMRLPLGFGEVKTDETGRFETSHAAAGRYWVKVYQSVPSADRCWQQMSRSGRLVLEPGQRVENYEIRVLPPGAKTISGTVVDGEGKPRPGAVVDAFIPHDRHWWTRTNEQGQFTLASMNGMGCDPVDVYFNETGLPAEGYKVVVRDVPIGTKDLKLVVHAPGEISGMVRDEGGTTPLADYEMTVHHVHLKDCAAIAIEPAVNVTKGDTPGAFRMTNVPAGKATVEIKVGERKQWVEVEVAPGQAASDVKFALQAPCVFEGAALFTGPRGDTQSVGLEVVHIETEQSMGSIESDKSGAFRNEFLPAGEFAVRALYGGEAYLTKNVRLEPGKTVQERFNVGGTCQIRGTITFPKEDHPFVNLLLREAGLTSQPPRWGGRPAPKEHVVVWNLARDSGGQYEFAYVPPGTWELVAFAFSSERCVPFDDLPHSSQVVTVREGEALQLDLNLTEPSQ